MDNLYMSAKLSRICYVSPQKITTHSVTQGSSRGLPACIAQPEVKRREDPQRQRETLKVDKLKHDPACGGFVAISMYDQNPVNLLSNICKWSG